MPAACKVLTTLRGTDCHVRALPFLAMTGTTKERNQAVEDRGHGPGKENEQ